MVSSSCQHGATTGRSDKPRQSATRRTLWKGMFTAGQVLQAAGLTSRDLTEDEQAVTLEDLLKESEELYGHTRNVVEHATNPRLTRYFYRYGGGRKRETEIEDTKEWESKGEVLQLKELLPPEKGEAVPTESEGYKKWLSLGTRLKKQKQKLTSTEDLLAECVAKLRDSQEEKADEQREKILAAQEEIRATLAELREHLALGNIVASLEVAKLADCNKGIEYREQLESTCELHRREATSTAEMSKLAWRRT